MNCDTVRTLAGAYALGALADGERQRVERHLDRCAACRAYVAELSEAAASLAAVVPPQAPPAELKQRILSAALQMARAERPQPARPAARHAASSGHRRRPVWGASVRVAAAVALVAVGWAAGRLVPGRPAEPTPGAVDELTRVRLERDLWRSVSAPGAAVMPLATDEGVAGAVAYASVQGDERGCWVRLVAEGLPDPPSGMRYAAWVSTRGGEWRLAGELSKAGSARWELSVRVDTSPAQLGTLQVVLQSEQAASPGSGRAIVWGQLWPAGQDW